MSLREQLLRETWQNKPVSSSGAVKTAGRRSEQQNPGKDKRREYQGGSLLMCQMPQRRWGGKRKTRESDILIGRLSLCVYHMCGRSGRQPQMEQGSKWNLHPDCKGMCIRYQSESRARSPSRNFKAGINKQIAGFSFLAHFKGIKGLCYQREGGFVRRTSLESCARSALLAKEGKCLSPSESGLRWEI